MRPPMPSKRTVVPMRARATSMEGAVKSIEAVADMDIGPKCYFFRRWRLRLRWSAHALCKARGVVGVLPWGLLFLACIRCFGRGCAGPSGDGTERAKKRAHWQYPYRGGMTAAAQCIDFQ